MSSRAERPAAPLPSASRRERQIMDIVYRLGISTAAEIRAQMEDAPTYTTVRGLLRVLVEKGQLEIGRRGASYTYKPVVAASAVGETMIAHVVRTFFGGSPSRALNALLGAPDLRLSPNELERLQRLVNEAEADGGRT